MFLHVVALSIQITCSLLFRAVDHFPKIPLLYRTMNTVFFLSLNASTWAVWEAHLSSLLLTSEQPVVCPRAARARTAGDLCEEEELSKFDFPREGKVLLLNEKRLKFFFCCWSFDKAEYLASLAWCDTFSPGASKTTMATRFLKWICLTSVLFLGCCVLAERKGMSGKLIQHERGWVVMLSVFPFAGHPAFV